MHAFIIRPFGTKNGIDFDRVDEELIRPALKAAGFSGGTTGELIQQGNIRTDMFEQLLIADLVIADISIHNANAFYELGIRHAFRDQHTFLIKSAGDEVPFDLKTDRYLAYDATDPAASLPRLIQALSITWNSQKQDSPVFQLLPGLRAADPSTFLVVPLDFREEVGQAVANRRCGDLQLLSTETEGFSWKTMGLRLIGQAQIKLKDWLGAKETWEAIRTYDEDDLEANLCLGTVYQRNGNLMKSNQALKRALSNPRASSLDRAEIQALLARNAKIQWEQDWKEIADLQMRQEVALISPYLEQCFDLYAKGFREDRDHYYSGLNALAMLTVILQLAAAQPEVWEDGFEFGADAQLMLQKYEQYHTELTMGVKLAIESRRAQLERTGDQDVWLEISDADLVYLRSAKPKRVGRAYRKALANASEFAIETVDRQLHLYEHLGILPENTQAALNCLSMGMHDRQSHFIDGQDQPQTQRPRVILFTGHRLDGVERGTPRFPRDRVDQARALILEQVAAIKQQSQRPLLGISGGANGGDILFHEVCEELGIPTKMFLVLPKNEYIQASVADGGPEWVERFNRLFERRADLSAMALPAGVGNQPEILSDSKTLPRWLRAKGNYNIWERSNLWMLHNALHISENDLVLIALWNGQEGDKPGGTEDMVERVKARGATFYHIDATVLTEPHQP